MTARYFGTDTTDQQYQVNRDAQRQRYMLEETVSNTGDWLIIPAGIGDICITVVPTASAMVEFTQSPVSSVLSGTASAKVWEPGEVTAETTKTMLNAVTAIRLVAIGGAASWSVTA